MKSALILALALAAGPLAHTQDAPPPPTPTPPIAAGGAPQPEPAPRPAKAEDPTRAADAPRAAKAPSAQRGIPTPPIAAGATPPAAPAFPGAAGNALGEALLLEETSSDLESATRRYEQAVRQYDQQREAAGIALLRLAEIQRKQKNIDAAVQLYSRVAVEFNDRPQLVDAAQQQLNTLAGPQAGGGAGMISPSHAWTPGGKVTNLDEQRDLLKQELDLVQKQLEVTQKQVEAGNAQASATIEHERELLKLKRELAALEGRGKSDLVELSTGGRVSSTSANILGSSANTITGTTGGGAASSFGSEGAGDAGMGGGAAGTTAATVPLNERLAASVPGKVPMLGDLPHVGRLFQKDAARDQSVDAKLSRIVGEIDMLESELQRLRWEQADVESDVELINSVQTRDLPEESVRSVSFSQLKQRYSQLISEGGNDENTTKDLNQVLEKMEQWKQSIYLPEKEAKQRALQIKMKNREKQLSTAKAQLEEIQDEIKKAEAEAATKAGASAKPTPLSPELMKRYGLTPDEEQKKF